MVYAPRLILIEMRRIKIKVVRNYVQNPVADTDFAAIILASIFVLQFWSLIHRAGVIFNEQCSIMKNGVDRSLICNQLRSRQSQDSNLALYSSYFMVRNVHCANYSPTLITKGQATYRVLKFSTSLD